MSAQYIDSITFVNGLATAISYQSIQATDLPASPVTPGSYTNTSITVDAYGRVTAASSGSGGGVTSVTNTDSSLTISPTTGNVVASLNTGHANAWTAPQTIQTSSEPQLTLGYNVSNAVTLTCDSSSNLIVGCGHFDVNLATNTYASFTTNSYNGNVVFLQNTNSGGYCSVTFLTYSGGFAGGFGYANTSAPNSPGQVFLSGPSIAFFPNANSTVGVYMSTDFKLSVNNGTNEPAGQIHAVCGSASTVGQVIQGYSGQTADLTDWKNSGNSTLSQIDALGAWHPPSIADTSAQDNSLYYSTTTSKLTYKDPSGNTHTFY